MGMKTPLTLPSRGRAIPVIIDTDIGTFADDTLALAQALGSPELDVRLLVTTSGDPIFRARVAAKQLRLSGRADVPIGIGVALPRLSPTEPLEPYVAGESLAAHSGGVHSNGPAAAVAMIRNSSRHDWVIVVLGPSSSVAAMLDIDPAIAGSARLAIMGASVCGGIVLPWDATTPRAATNERQDVPAARAVGAAPWRRPPEYATVVSSLQIELKGERWARLREPKPSAPSPTFGMLDAFDAWWQASRSDREAITHLEALAIASPRQRSVLCFDCLAVALAVGHPIGAKVFAGRLNFSDEGYSVQRMERPDAVEAGGICVSPSCHVPVASCNLTLTRAVDNSLWPVRFSIGWENLDLFLDDLVGRLGSSEQAPSPEPPIVSTKPSVVALVVAVIVILLLAMVALLARRRRNNTGLRHVRHEGDDGVEMPTHSRPGAVERPG